MLQNGELMEERALAEVISSRAEMLYYKGELDFFESLSVDGIINVLDWAASQTILLRINVLSTSPTEHKQLANNKIGARLYKVSCIPYLSYRKQHHASLPWHAHR